jgi:NodT family efflux transporter outer membrane factor (OMF) lipoprotein
MNTSARASLRSGLAAAFAIPLLSGCVVGKAYQEPALDTPPQFVAQSVPFTSAQPSDHWWTALMDSQLDALIDTALAGNPDLLAAEARVRASRAQLGASESARKPQITADGKLSRDKLSKNGELLANLPFPNPKTEFTDYRAGFDASWEIDIAGRTRHSIEAANARLDGTAESLNNARVVLAAEVVNDYVSFRIGQHRLKLAQDTLDAFTQTRNLVDRQWRAGAISDLEQRRASADQQSAAANIPPLEAEMNAALYRLAALTGMPAADLISRLNAIQPIPSLPESVPVGLPSDLLRRRPDVRRAEREFAAASADLGVAIAEQYPRFTLIGDVGLESIRTGDFAAAASRYWNLAPQLSVPLLSGGRLKQTVHAGEATRDAALQSYRSAVLQALADTESALIRFSHEESRAQSLGESYRTLQGSLELARQRYRAGEAALTEVLDVQRETYRIADQHVQSQGQAVLYFASLHKSLGGGWSGGSR